MANPQEAVALRKELRRHLRRCLDLQERCLSQVIDGDVRMVDRVTAEHRLQMLLRETASAERQLRRVDEALAANH